MNRISARTAVVGVARSETPFTPGKTSLQLHAELAREAIADAGLAAGDIDGVLTAGCDEPTYCEDVAHSAVLCEYMGLRPRFTYSVDLGTPVFAKMVEIAATAITSGLCHTVLLACAEPSVSRASRRGAVEKMASFGHPDFELPYGVSIPAFYALIARRHMHEFGTTPEQLARVAVTMRQHAGLNPGARFREPISVDEVLASRLIADPLHKLDCCITTDGGGALVVTSIERARDLRRMPVVVLGTAQGFSHEHLVAAPSLTAFGNAPASAFEMAGLGPCDVDVAMLYDNFTISVVVQLEDLGFCAKGEGRRFRRRGGNRARRAIAGESARRPALGEPPGATRRDLAPRRGRRPAPGRCRRASGRRRPRRPRARRGRYRVQPRHRDPRAGVIGGPAVPDRRKDTLVPVLRLGVNDGSAAFHRAVRDRDIPADPQPGNFERSPDLVAALAEPLDW